MKENIKHLKLTNNDEIVCEIVSFPDNDESDEIVIKRALKIITVEDYFRGFRFLHSDHGYRFKMILPLYNL